MNREEEKTDLQKRSQIIKSLTVGGVAVTAWNKPIINSVLLPAHADVSPNGGTGSGEMGSGGTGSGGTGNDGTGNDGTGSGGTGADGTLNALDAQDRLATQNATEVSRWTFGGTLLVQFQGNYTGSITVTSLPITGYRVILMNFQAENNLRIKLVNGSLSCDDPFPDYTIDRSLEDWPGTYAFSGPENPDTGDWNTNSDGVKQINFMLYVSANENRDLYLPCPAYQK